MESTRKTSQNIITFCSPKGGVGRSTIVRNLAAAMGELGQRVLLIDSTPTEGGQMGKREGPAPGIIQALLGEVAPAKILSTHPHGGFQVVGVGHATPNDVLFYEKEALMGGLSQVLLEISRGFDLVLCDPPAGLGAVTKANLEISHWAIPVTTCQAGTIRTLPQIASFVAWLKKRVNPGLKIGGIILAMFNQDCRCQIEIRKYIEKKIRAYFFETTIPMDKTFERASFKGCLVKDLANTPDLKGLFDSLAREVLDLTSSDRLNGGKAGWGATDDMDPIGQILTSLSREAGIQVAVVADEKGFPIASYVEFNEQADLFAAFAPLMGESLQKAEWLLGIRGLEHVILEDKGNTTLHLRKITIEGASYYLLVQAPKTQDVKSTVELMAFRVEGRLR